MQSCRRLFQRLSSGETTAEEIVRASLARIAEQDGVIGAFTYVAAQSALGAAERASGPLLGLPVAVKDIYDTADMPTSYGSDIYCNHRPGKDAQIVRRLRAAGGTLIGKTVTAEFAHVTPRGTRNPHDLSCSPGGSSSGSAAAVAACMVPLALGTQTGGSTIRPASYCGVFGFKPTFGILPMDGVRPLCPSLDTAGILASDAFGLALLYTALVDPAARPTLADLDNPALPSSFLLCHTHAWDSAEPQMREAVERAGQALAKGGAIEVELDLAPLTKRASELQLIIANGEIVETMAAELADHPDALSPALLGAADADRKLSPSQLHDARAEAQELRVKLKDCVVGIDCIVTPAAPGTAPRDLGSIGAASFNSAWTLLHLPCATVPAPVEPGALPLGIQLVGHAGADRQLLAYTAALADIIAN